MSTGRDHTDEQLIAAVRADGADSFAALYERHVAAARRFARSLAGDPADAEDLVSEAFAKLLTTLRSGGGPDLAFRPYLLTTVRNVHFDRIRRDQRIKLADDLSEYEPEVPYVDPAVAAEERSLVWQAFAKLPEKWQVVLWHTEVDGEKPAAVAPLLGLTANGVAVQAYRAREALRQNYLREHVLVSPPPAGCQPTVDRLGAHVRGGLSKRDRAQVDQHLSDCDRCRELCIQLWDVNASLKGVLAPAVLGSAAAATYLGPGAAAGGPAGPWGGVRRLVRRRSVQVAGVTGVLTAVAAAAMAMALTGASGPEDAALAPPSAAVPEAPGPGEPAPEPTPTPVSEPSPAPVVTPTLEPATVAPAGPPPAREPAGDAEPPPGQPDDRTPPGDDGGAEPPPEQPPGGEPSPDDGGPDPGPDPEPEPDPDPDPDPDPEPSTGGQAGDGMCLDLSVLSLIELLVCLGILG